MKRRSLTSRLGLTALTALTLAALAAAACSSSPELSEEGDGEGEGGAPGGRDTIVLGGGGDSGVGGAPEPDKPAITILETLPEGFVGADALGGWQVVGLLDETDIENTTGCGNVLRAIARDFPASHPDFQRGATGLVLGIVEDELSADRKPVFADLESPEDLVESQETFDQWYRNVEENLAFVIDFWLEPVGETFVFDSSSFFPLEDRGFALESCQDCSGQGDGFHFTTELHTNFVYQGGEEFTFRGDDDVWVFINNRLAIDLGGVHGAIEGSISLDDEAEALGIEVGKSYPLDLFQAERQTSQSNFRIETTLDFTDCGEILESDIVR